MEMLRYMCTTCSRKKFINWEFLGEVHSHNGHHFSSIVTCLHLNNRGLYLRVHETEELGGTSPVMGVDG